MPTTTCTWAWWGPGDGPQRLVPLAVVAARAEASPRVRRSAARRLADEAQLELLRHRIDQLELRAAALERSARAARARPEEA